VFAASSAEERPPAELAIDIEMGPRSRRIYDLTRELTVIPRLLLKGIASNRMRTVGRGENETVASNEIDAGRAENRRIEFYMEKIAGEEIVVIRTRDDKSLDVHRNSSGGIMAAKILLVDDHKNRRDSVLAMLKSEQSLVVEAADCANALSTLASEKFDLILLDITPPDRSGFQILKFLEENHVASKVMIITGTMGVANVIRSATPGAREYITKPFNPDDLLKSIEHILSERAHANLRLQIIQAGDLIKSTPTGDLDLSASREGLAQIAASGAELQEYTVLIDLRDVRSRLSISDIYDLAFELLKYGETFRRKTAVLVRAGEDIGQAKFFENTAQNRGFEVRTFTEFEKAIIWLSSITHLTEEQ
jgi:DNA-binding response OmpR family regulator